MARPTNAAREAAANEAATMFMEDRRRGLDSEPAKPAEPPKEGKPAVRPWISHPDTGVRHVTATVPMGEHGQANMVGVLFDDDKKRTEDEKPMLEAAGLKHYKTVKPNPWLKPNHRGAIEETQALAEKIHERRRQQAEEERGR